MSEPTPSVNPPSTVGVSARSSAVSWRKVVQLAEPVSVALFFIYLLEYTWMRWPDPLIDFPRELYMAWRVSEGDLLYDKIMNWYGPLPQLMQGLGFKIFGVGLDTMAWMNIALTVGVLLVLRGIFGVLGNRLMVWLASVVFLGVFAFCQYNIRATNFTFIAPYVSQATYGFAGLLLVIWGLLRHLQTGRSIWLVVAGLGAGIAYLDKPEAVLAAGGALGIYLAAQFIRQARLGAAAKTAWRSGAGWLAGSLGWLAAGFFAICLPVFIYFWSRGGFGFALRATNWVLRSVLDPATRRVMASSPLMMAVTGFNHPWENFVVQVKAGAGLGLVSGVMVLAGRAWAREGRFGVKKMIFLLVAIGACGAGEWLGWSEYEWGEVGHAFVFPAWVAAMVAAGWSLWSAWRGEEIFSRILGLAVLGVPASLMLARMILNGHIDSYGFVMMPLAVLFWIHLLAVEAARAGPARMAWLLPALAAMLALSGTLVLLRFNLKLYANKTYAVGEGRDRFYFYPPEINPQGQLLNLMIASFKQGAPNAKTLVAFPHGIAINYHCRVPSTVAESEFNPIALGFAGPQHVVNELNAHPPDAAILFDAEFRVFGLRYFGQTEASGSGIIEWLNQRYKVIALGGATNETASGHQVDLMVPKDAPGPRGMPLLPTAK